MGKFLDLTVYYAIEYDYVTDCVRHGQTLTKHTIRDYLMHEIDKTDTIYLQSFAIKNKLDDADIIINIPRSQLIDMIMNYANFEYNDALAVTAEVSLGRVMIWETDWSMSKPDYVLSDYEDIPKIKKGLTRKIRKKR